jgi:hypothetical protein
MRTFQIIFGLILFNLLLILSASLCLAADYGPLNLYRVSINSQQEADRLSGLDLDIFCRVNNGYLVLATNLDETRMSATGLTYSIVTTAVDRRHLAIDNRLDDFNVGKYPIVFEEYGLRIFMVEDIGIINSRGSGLASMEAIDIPVVYSTPALLDKSMAVSPEILEAVVDGIREDSLVSYSEHLQAYNGRWVGSSGIALSAYWAKTELQNYGYDSVVIDTFVENIGGEDELCRNVMAYKIGSEYPYYHTILCAHRDSEYGSPGADDNGSGVAAVMEIARVLRNIDTRTTFVFILFDAEEEGLRGARHYVRNSTATDERISFVQNLDMIAHYENDNDVYVYQGYSGDPYALLWADLADSIPSINLTGHIDNGGGGSDHLPFQDYGYEALFIHEYIFSTVYHSYTDSTTYLNFDYMTRVTKASAATAYVADQQFIPEYELLVTLVNDLPELIYPNETTPINIAVREYGGAQLVPGSVLLHYSVNGGEEIIEPMMTGGDDVYYADLPTFNCLDAVEYYFSAEDDSLGTVYYPGQDEIISANVATGQYTIFEDYFETDKGWTVTTDAMRGEWEYVVGTRDYDGNGYYYYARGTTGGVHNGTTSLVSPPIEINGQDGVLEYARWSAYTFGYDPATQEDIFYALISGNGVVWHVVEAFEPVDYDSRGWKAVEFRVSDYLNSPQVIWLRFDVVENGSDDYVRAAVDAVRVIGYATDIQIVTNEIPNWTAGHPFSFQLEASICGDDTLSWNDRLNQLDGTGLTLSTDGLLSGIPDRVGPVLFRAEVADQSGGITEQVMDFIIYDSLRITTNSISTASIDEVYSCQLHSSGGTGNKYWSDLYGDLGGTGISLSPDGLLSGTPPAAGDYPFIAHVTDDVGALDEIQLLLHIIGPYTCGDANSDGRPDIGDAVYLIGYIFRSGPAPDPLEAGDANCDGEVNVGDAVYVINYVFNGGPEPCCP